MVVDATGIIRYVESGFMGYLNDAQTFGLMCRIGTELCFPEQNVLLGDKINRIGNCIMTPCTAAHLARKEDRMKRKCKNQIVYFPTT